MDRQADIGARALRPAALHHRGPRPLSGAGEGAAAPPGGAGSAGRHAAAGHARRVVGEHGGALRRARSAPRSLNRRLRRREGAASSVGWTERWRNRHARSASARAALLSSQHGRARAAAPPAAVCRLVAPGVLFCALLPLAVPRQQRWAQACARRGRRRPRRLVHGRWRIDAEARAFCESLRVSRQDAQAFCILCEGAGRRQQRRQVHA